MPDPLTSNIQLAVPIRGSDVGTWDVPVNGDFTIIDASFGGITSVGIGSTTVTLLTSQAQVNILRFTANITAPSAVVLPNIIKFWTVENLTVGNFSLTLGTTAVAGQVIGLPPGEACEVYSDGTNLKFRNLGRVGTYWDYAGSSVPFWVSASTVPPFLNCDATSFSSATYPYLANLLGTTTLPDLRGNSRATLNQGSSRLTSSGGIDGNTRFATGGAQGVIQSSAQVAPHTHVASVNDPGHVHSLSAAVATISGGFTNSAGGSGQTQGYNGVSALAAVTGITVSVLASTTPATPMSVVQPTIIAGITMIRAA